ncbi:MAG: hypothetical protein WBM68_14660 [Woeseia sp.]
MRNLSLKDVVLPIIFFAFLILVITDVRAGGSRETAAAGSTIEIAPESDGIVIL